MAQNGEITILLGRISSGDPSAEAELIERVYPELRRLAARFIRAERTGHTLQATALVHEVFLKLAGTEKISFVDRSHFFAVVAQIMRRLLVDYGRRHRSRKRGGGHHAPLDEEMPVSHQPDIELRELDMALDRLALSEPRQAKVVEMRYFGGMSEEEIAAHLNVSSRTVKRDWVLARATLYAELYGGLRKNPS